MVSAKVFFFLITSALFLQYTSQEKAIRGSPEVDYPTYYVIPKTSFRCSDQLYNPGFYADTETRCQVFHYCYEHRQESFLCPMGTIFNQPILTCDFWYSSNCSLAPSYYHVNADRRNEDRFDEANDSLNSPSENLFDKMAHLYEVNKTPESPASVKNYSNTPENEFLGKGGFESSAESLTGKNNKTEDYNAYNYDNRFNMVDEEHPEIVKYEMTGLNTLNIREGSENDQFYETDNVQDFIFSEDGMLHQSRDDTYQIHPTDMNLNQEYSDYVDFPNEGNFNYGLNDELDPETDFQISDFELHKRYADTNGKYVRRPSSRKPVIVIPEAEPEIVQLPIVKYKRKPIGKPTIGTTESSHVTNYDFSTYKDTASVESEVSESTTSDEFPLDGPNLDLNTYELRQPNLFYENQEGDNDEDGSQPHQTGSLSEIYDYSDEEKIRNENVPSNNDENKISSDVYDSGSNDFLGVSNAEYPSTFMDSKYGSDLETFIGIAEGSTILPVSLETSSEEEGSFDSDAFLGSGSEDVNLSHSRDRSSFPEDQDVFSDSEDVENTDSKSSYLLPMNLFDASEGSGFSMQETAGMAKFNEFNEPNQFVLKGYEDSIQYAKESSFSSDTFENFLPLENLEETAEEELESVPEGSGESNGFDFPRELGESPDNSQDASDKMVPEIREIDGTYYVFSDSEDHYEYDDSSAFSTANANYALAENFDDISDQTSEEFDNEESRYYLTDSEIQMDNIDGSQHSLGYQESKNLENTHENLSDDLEVETSSHIPEGYMVEDSDTTRQQSTEDLKYLEIMSKNPSTMENLFDVSTGEKSSSEGTKEKPRGETISQEQDSNEQVAIHEDPASMGEEYGFETIASDATLDGEHSPDIKFSENNSEILNAEQNAEEVSNAGGSGEDESQIFSHEQNLEALVPRKEADPFNSLFAEGNDILDDTGKQKLSFKVPAIQPKNTVASPVMGKDLKKVARGKRLDGNIRTFNPPNKGKPSTIPSRETFREAMFTSIPSTFLKMKHSTLRPYFYDYDVKKSGLIPRSGDLLESSKLSKLTTWGKRLLAAKSAKFNRMKKYIDSYRN